MRISGWSALALAITATSLQSQSVSRHGSWFSAGVGYGGAKSLCDSCSGEGRIGGTIVSLRAGTFLSSSFRLGGALEGWVHSYNGASELMANTFATLTYTIRGLSDFFIPDGSFLTVGLGLSNYRSEIVRHVADTVPGLSGLGWGFTLGVGYDVSLSRHFALTPTGNYVRGYVGDLNRTDGGGGYTTGWKQSYYDVRVSLTWNP